MSQLNMINELSNRRQSIEKGGGDAAIKKIHAQGMLTARERLSHLLDENSFVEVGAFIQARATDFNLSEKETPADGVVTGYGTIEGRLVYAFSQDATVLGGALGEMHAKKIANLYDMAMKMGAPIIALLDSSGIRLQESTDALNGFGDLFYKQTLASGVIPQITAVLGQCGGGASMIPALSDFVFMTAQTAKLFVNSPNALNSKTETFESMASAKFHSKETGLVDMVAEDDTSCLQQIRMLMDILPSNNIEEAPILESGDDLNRISEDLNTILPQEADGDYDVKSIIAALADNAAFIELKADYGTSVVTGFARLNGLTVGIVANQSFNGESRLTSSGCEKASKFVSLCDAFNISILTLTDVQGFAATLEEEKTGLSKYSSKLLYSFAHATVPKVNVILRKAFGTAYICMNSKHVGADFVYAWPTASISMMDAKSAVSIMYADEIEASDNVDIVTVKTEEFEALQASPYAAASRGYVDDIIEPAATRKRIIAAFEMLYSKRETRPAKKHGTV